jgi:undecaprenyl phosphate-alpha-L-ara4N flippase subunit ArnE
MTPLVGALFALTVGLEVWGQTAFKLGLDKIGDLDGAAFWRGIATSPWVIGGLLGYAVEAVCWLYVLGHVPLSVAAPMAALSYTGAVLSGRLFLGERPGMRRWAGAGLITFGAALLGASLG